jgi:DNA-binding NtrC family response regulator
MARVLIVDDDPQCLGQAAAVASTLGHAVLTVAGGDEALALLRADPLIDAVLLDLVMPDRDGMAVIEAMAREHIRIPTIVVATPETAATALNAGAIDFVERPVTPVRLGAALTNARRLAALESLLRDSPPDVAGEFIATSPAMARLGTGLRKFARSDLPLLIEGEAGSGREHFARLVHGNGARSGRPFIICDGEPDDLHAALAKARGGTLLIREIGRLRPETRQALLGFLETGAIRPAGAARPLRLDVRLIATSSIRLVNLARTGEIEPRLFDRLNVLAAYLPPLRERREDIAPLAHRFLVRHAVEAGRRVTDIAPQTMRLLAGHDWPDNVRGLERTIRRAVALARGGVLEPADFPALLAARDGWMAAEAVRDATAPSEPVHVDCVIPTPKQMEGPGAAPDRFLTPDGEVAGLAEVERDLIVFALGRHGGHMSRLARTLGIGRSTLYRKMRELGLDGGASYGVADEPVDAAPRRKAIG